MIARKRGWCGILVAWFVALSPGFAQALPPVGDEPSPLQERGAEVRTALLLDYYRKVPSRLDGEENQTFAVRLQEGLDTYKQEVSARYGEGTLQRLLDAPHGEARRASVLALGLTGTMACNKALAGRLRDEDGQVRQLASDALWAIWFRADAEGNNKELQRILRLAGPEKMEQALDALIKKAPNFAEAYNQRAILHFRQQDYQKSAADCEATVKLNPYHFGAFAGMAQCHMKLRKPRAALKAFRAALRINPNLEGVEDTIRTLEDVLGEEGRKDDKK